MITENHIEELKASIKSAAEIIRLLENRKEEEAYNRLAQLLDSIRWIRSEFSSRSFLRTSAEPANAEMSREEIAAVFERALTQLVHAQELHYWVSICEVIEYEIVPILELWPKGPVSTSTKRPG